MTFSSVYEMTNPLTTVRKQHFWDWFSGDSLNSRWTFNNHIGTNTGAMNDSVDGGYNLLCASSNLSQCSISFGNGTPKRNLNPAGSVFIGIFTPSGTASAATWLPIAGMIEKADILEATNHLSYVRNQPSETYMVHACYGGAWTTTNTSVATKTSGTFGLKIQNSASNSIASIDGVVDTTITTNLPTNGLMPNISVRETSPFTGSIDVSVRYMECYNT